MPTEAEELALCEELVERGITWDDVRIWINESVQADGNWGGAPMPLDNERLVVEPRYPYPKLNGFQFNEVAAEEPFVGKVRNQWYSHSKNATVYVVEENGKIETLLVRHGSGDRLGMLVHTLGCASAWAASAELKALEKLRDSLSEHAFRCYLTAGMFLETSPRSHATYLFRRLRPTIAMRGTEDGMRVLACLCLHPIGYYSGTFAGCQTPTDDVLSHLLLMRADEHSFWKWCEQHRPWELESGI